jgi:penicillin G amidase
MNLSDKDLLQPLGAGAPIATVCKAAGCTRAEFDRWWQETIDRRVPRDGQIHAPVASAVQVERDEWGIPHIYADNDMDLFVAFGYAMAEDRLFQMDYLRRKSTGRLAQILGEEALASDVLVRTVDLPGIASTEWDRLPTETQQLLTSFTAGVNAVIEQSMQNLPVEFDLLDYAPERWTEIDCLAIESEFRWYLTGRFPVIVIPELAKRTLGEDVLYRQFMSGEAMDEYILPADGYPGSSKPHPAAPLSPPMGGFDDGTGSNNWVVSGKRTESGKPLVASDPHIAIEAVSCWYQAHLCGGSFNVAGMSYVGMPAIMFGRSEQVAWGMTNNICSLRDLYQEKTDADHPNCFLYDGQWEPWHERTETIDVRHEPAVVKEIRISRNGPIVDESLPPPANATGPVALKWLGMFEGGWLTAMLAMNRARNVAEFNDALRPWHVPTFSLVFADTAGDSGLKISGRIPLRQVEERGYRPGWDPAHQWDGLLAFENMPGVINPEQGFAMTANNPVATDDFPFPLSCTSPAGYRARRIRQLLATNETAHTPATFGAMQRDALSLRATHCLPHLLRILDGQQDADTQAQQAIEALRSWDGHVLPDAVGATIFNVFIIHWTRVVLAERFDEATQALLAPGAEGLATTLLEMDEHGWFANDDREARCLDALRQALTDISQRLGADLAGWQWDKLHRLMMPHVLAGRGELGQLLTYAGMGVRGDMQTVGNTGGGADWESLSGGGFRMIADLTDTSTLYTVDAPSQSGHPGSPHYKDQLSDWLDGNYHELPLQRDKVIVSRSKQLLPTISK